MSWAGKQGFHGLPYTLTLETLEKEGRHQVDSKVQLFRFLCVPICVFVSILQKCKINTAAGAKTCQVGEGRSGCLTSSPCVKCPAGAFSTVNADTSRDICQVYGQGQKMLQLILP